MHRPFTGRPEAAFDVLTHLQGEPSREVCERWREDRERLVGQPMIALLNEVVDADPACEDFSVWHYRTTAWWWQHQCAVIRRGHKVEIGLRLDLDGLRVQGGWWYPVPEQIARFRQAVAAEGSGRHLAEIVQRLEKDAYDVTGDVMKRAPRGFPADHPRAGLLRHRSIIAVRRLGCDDWLHTRQAVDRTLEAVTQLADLMAWLDRQVNR